MSTDSLRKRAGLNWINLLIFLLILAACSQSPLEIDENTPEPDQQEAQPYLGQEFPGSAVKRFAPSIFKDEMHAPPIFTPDGREVYWSMMDEPRGVRYMKIEDGVWTDPAPAPFDLKGQGDSPFIYSDGTRLIYLSSSGSNTETIWQVEREDGIWGSPQELPDMVNENGAHWQASMADNGNLYFGSSGKVNFSALENGSYSSPEIFDWFSSTDNPYAGSPFIAPDESYLIFDYAESRASFTDLFITFRNEEGGWDEPIAMEALNSGAHDLYANVSPDGRFLMFLSARSGGILLPYWVDAEIIESFRPNN